MPKSKKHRHVRGYEIWRLADCGQLQSVPMGSDRVLKTLERKSPTLPPLKKGHRKIAEKRMGIPKGSFLNARWMKIQPSWDIWDQVAGVDPRTDIEAKHRLASQGIIMVDGAWCIFIYEVVSGLTKLLRQQVHRDSQYEVETAHKEPLARAIEHRFAEHALKLASLTAAELSELTALQNKVSRRLRDITVIRSHLAFRKMYVYAIAEATLNELRGLIDSVELAANNVRQLSRKNADSFLMRLAERLNLLYSSDIWRPLYWGQWNILEAATDVMEANPLRARFHLLKAVAHLREAQRILSSWADSIPEAERKYIARY